ncbi:MAG: tRNA (adenosine(37)-N6)-threonylcarbamoyltransferase complex transferase subunit TsaD, partial [Candidatus Gracilibacteria bacterium]|nr:tRNA (adenosine(37)-N6)-threonylcarbamoyltransferase complex transferase subunit TsaD [Candidatus Gracilibacteria bacterium]
KQFDYIVCTKEPGLLPSLLVGLSVANTFGKLLGIPVVEINHIKAHIFANYLEREEKDLEFPALCLTVSGGHNEIYLWKSMFDLELIGESLDDAAGEAFDKVAKMLDLEYPGGPIISRLSSEYTGEFRGIFPKVLLKNENIQNFSFSGLKSAVKREIDSRLEKKGKLTLEDKKEIAFEFEKVTVDTLKTRLFEIAKKLNIKNLVLAGGVSANNRLKDEIVKEGEKTGIKVLCPVSNVYSQDNAAMVGIYGYYLVKNKRLIVN